MLLFLNYYVTAKILRFVTPAFRRLAAVERGLEVSVIPFHDMTRNVERFFLIG